MTVVLRDMHGAAMMGGSNRSMALQASRHTVAAGKVSLVAVNHGSRKHELVVLPLPAGAPAGQRAVDAAHRVAEDGSLGEASRNCGPSAGDGIAPGSAGWVTVTLQPGRYELLCNLPGHYAAGMFTEIDVLQRP